MKEGNKIEQGQVLSHVKWTLNAKNSSPKQYKEKTKMEQEGNLKCCLHHKHKHKVIRDCSLGTQTLEVLSREFSLTNYPDIPGKDSVVTRETH